MKKLNKKGFTIVELVIVIAVIAVLAAVLIPTFASIINKANESSDIQATRDMNTFLAVANVTSDVDSILDVYEIFDESGFEIENYKPLYEGRTFYYDTTYNQILYVDDATGKVIFPEEHKDETKGTHDWFTLSMEIEAVAIAPDTSVSGQETYAVTSAGEYAYIAEKLNASFPANTSVVIDLQEDLDLAGASIAIKSVPKGASFTINGNGNTLKNITANSFSSTGVGADANRKYIAAGLIGSSEGTVSITNITLENVNVKDVDAGNVALVVGYLADTANVISDVTIKNSTVIGHRSVGAVVGMLYDNIEFTNITLENVSVQTVAGRSGLLFGFASMGGVNYTVNNLETTNSTFGIYECDHNKGEGCSIVDYAYAGTYGTNATKQITSYSVETNGTKEYRTYGFNENALGCVWNPNKAENGTNIDNFNNEYRYCYFALVD